MIILGINAYHPDASVALLQDGVLVWAAEEEQFNRVKHSSGFPKMAIQRCLKETGIHPEKINAVAISKNPRAHFFKKALYVLRNKPVKEMIVDRIKVAQKGSQFSRDVLDALSGNASSFKAKFFHIEHHQAHMASSFYVSGFDQAACLSIDGLGDFSSTQWGIGHEWRARNHCSHRERKAAITCLGRTSSRIWPSFCASSIHSRPSSRSSGSGCSSGLSSRFIHALSRKYSGLPCRKPK